MRSHPWVAMEPSHGFCHRGDIPNKFHALAFHVMKPVTVMFHERLCGGWKENGPLLGGVACGSRNGLV